MSYRELFVSSSPVFSGSQRAYEEAHYAIFGVPLDVSSTYRSGARFAPLAIREASLNIETYSFRAAIDIEDLKLHDLGDLHVSGDVDETLKRLELVVKDILSAGKMLVAIGGEHTVTLGMVHGVGSDVAVVSLDAHLDLRNEYLGRNVSHATFMRRLHENIDPEKIIEIGTRAVCKEELDYAKNAGIEFLTAHQIRSDGIEKTVEKVKEALSSCERTYLTIDMDVLDPAIAPAVQNPEPEGLSMDALLDILCAVCDRRVVGLDLVEVAPHYDQGITTIQAAKTIFEALGHIEKARKG